MLSKAIIPSRARIQITIVMRIVGSVPIRFASTPEPAAPAAADNWISMRRKKFCFTLKCSVSTV